MTRNKLLFTASMLLVFHLGNGQGNFDDHNFLGITGGLSFFNINTSDFVTKSEPGFVFGLTTRGAFRNNFDLIYGISFQGSYPTVEEENSSGAVNEIGYNIEGLKLIF